MSTLTMTIEDVMSLQPCYDEERVIQLFAGRESLRAIDILDLDIPAEDRLWAVIRDEVIEAPILHEFGCWCAEQALALVQTPDPRSVAAIAAKRAWLRGEIDDAQLAAARDAASDAEWSAAWSAARAAARAAAWAASDAEWSAAWSAARAAAWAARDAARDATSDAAWSAARAADSAAVWSAASDADWSAISSAARAAQIEYLREVAR